MDHTTSLDEIKALCEQILDLVKGLSAISGTSSGTDRQGTEDVILDYQDVCQLLHISLRHLRRLHNTGELVGFKIGRRRFYRTSELQRFLHKVETAKLK